MSGTIKDKINFNYNGIWSDTFGLVNVVLDNSMFEEQFVSERGIVETEIQGSDEPVFHKIINSPLELELTFAFEKGFHRDMLDDVIDWLFSDYYKPLFFEGKEDRVYRCVAVGDTSLVHNGLNQGYFNITFRCNSSRLYSPITTTSELEVIGEDFINIYSDGHYDIYPEISIEKLGDGNIVIESLYDNNEIFEIRNLTDLEKIYIDCKRELIETDAIGIYRYDDIVGLFPRILRGNNEFKISGNCNIKIRYSLEYKM